MEAKRVDMILGGLILLEELMSELDAKKMRSTDFSLRDGILTEEIDLAKKQKSSHIELHLEDLFAFAEKFGGDREYLERLERIAVYLFDRLQPLHRLRQEWRIYLVASVILRDLGELVCPAGYEKHTYYIVKNADIPAMEPWEAEFIALLCKEQADDDAVKLRTIPKDKQDAFKKLLALLRVIDAIDLGPEQNLDLKKIFISRSKIILSIQSKIKGGMEALFLERKRKDFEDTFRRKIYVQKV
jgi:exopolyphosphatase/guanosine-5'-triphosphate,3'-diphosphate pyrophosphatase